MTDAELGEVLTRIADQGSPHARLLREAARRLCRKGENEFPFLPGWESVCVIARSDPPRTCAYLSNDGGDYANGERRRRDRWGRLRSRAGQCDRARVT